jgi:hypothetical protein
MFRDGATGGRIEIVDLGDSAPSTGVGHNDAGVDREGLAPTMSSLHTAPQRLEQLPQDVALWEMAVFFDDVE